MRSARASRRGPVRCGPRVTICSVGKTKEQCLQRYTMSLAPGVKKGYWTPIEDAQLEAAVESAI